MNDRAAMNDAPLALPAPEGQQPLPAPAKKDDGASRKRVRLLAVAALVLLALVAIGWFFHHRQAKRAQDAMARDRDRLPRVGVIDVRESPRISELLLPGNVTPITEASLYARSSGYLRTRYVDIGDLVKRGQVLGEVDSPDLDQDVLQARANVAQTRQQLRQAESAVGDARARVVLTRTTYQRVLILIKDDATSQQDVDQRRQDFESAEAMLANSIANVGAARETVRAAEANAQRLAVLQGYEKLRAPFDGVITARNVDVGALIGATGGTASASGTTPPSSSARNAASSTSTGTSSASSSGTSGGGTSGGGAQPTELFRVAQVDRLRVFVTVPQENANGVEAGNEARVFVQGLKEPVMGRVVRTARAIDPVARTLLTEVEVANAQRRLLPGMYAQVRFTSPRDRRPLLIPGEAVIARAHGTSVALIEDLRDEDRPHLPDAKDKDQAKRIHLQEVQVGRDYGTEVEVVDGLQAGRRIVANPGDDVREGAFVKPEEPRRDDEGASKLGKDAAPKANESPSRAAPTKGQKS